MGGVFALCYLLFKEWLHKERKRGESGERLRCRQDLAKVRGTSREDLLRKDGF